MEVDQLAFILKELQFSAVLPPDVVNRLADEASTAHFESGQSIFREGCTNTDLYLLRDGRIALEMSVPGRGAVRILTLGAGEMVGWSALLGNGKMTASAVAVEATDVVVVPAERLRKLCETERDFGFHLMEQMADALAKRLVATRLQLLDLFAEAPQSIPLREAD